MATKKIETRSQYAPTDADASSARNKASVRLGETLAALLKRNVAIEANGVALVVHLSVNDANALVVSLSAAQMMLEARKDGAK